MSRELARRSLACSWYILQPLLICQPFCHAGQRDFPLECVPRVASPPVSLSLSLIHMTRPNILGAFRAGRLVVAGAFVGSRLFRRRFIADRRGGGHSSVWCAYYIQNPLCSAIRVAGEGGSHDYYGVVFADVRHVISEVGK